MTALSQTGENTANPKGKRMLPKNQAFLVDRFAFFTENPYAKFSELFDKWDILLYNISATGSDSRGYVPNGT